MLSPLLRPQFTPKTSIPSSVKKDEQNHSLGLFTMHSPKIDKAKTRSARNNRIRQTTSHHAVPTSGSSTASSSVHTHLRNFHAELQQNLTAQAAKQQTSMVDLQLQLEDSLATNQEQTEVIRNLVVMLEQVKDAAEVKLREVSDERAEVQEENILAKQELDNCKGEILSLKNMIQDLEIKIATEEACHKEDETTIIQLQNEVQACTSDVHSASSDLSEATRCEYDAYQEYLGSKDNAIVELEHSVNDTKVQTVLWQELQQSRIHAGHWKGKFDHVNKAYAVIVKQLVDSRKEAIVSKAKFDQLDECMRLTYMTKHALQTQFNELTQNTQGLAEQYYEMKSKYQEANRQLRRYQQEAELARVGNEQNKEQKLAIKVYELEEKLDESQRSEKAIRQDWKIARDHVKYLEADKRMLNGRLESGLKARDDLIKEKEDALADAQQKLETAQSQLATAQSRLSTAQLQLHDTKANDELLAQLENLQTQLDDNTIELKVVSQDLAARDAEARNLTAQLAETEQDLEAARSARNDIFRQKELDTAAYQSDNNTLKSRVEKLEEDCAKSATKLHTLNSSRTYLSHLVSDRTAHIERLNADLNALKSSSTTALDEAQTIIRRLQIRARLADENAAFWADALAEGVAMSAEWRQDVMQKVAGHALGRGRDLRGVVEKRDQLERVCLRIRGLLIERGEMVREIEALRSARDISASQPHHHQQRRLEDVEERGGKGEMSMSSEMMEEQRDIFAESYESVGGDVGEAVRQTLSERSDSVAGSRLGEVEEEKVVKLVVRRASWS